MIRIYNFAIGLCENKLSVYMTKPTMYVCTLQYISRVIRKSAFRICENKGSDQLQDNCTADQGHCFLLHIVIVQSLFFLNPKFQAFSHLLWLYSLVCVGPGQKP